MKIALLVTLQFTLILIISASSFVVNPGVDIERYVSIGFVSFPIDKLYYLKEFFSWGVVYGASKASGGDENFFLFLINFFLLSVAGLNFMKGNIKLLPYLFVFLSPMVVLLSFNVTRQYMSVVFFAVALVYFMQKRGRIFCFYSALALFSHNSIFVYFVLAIVSKKLSKLMPAVHLLTLLSVPAVYILTEIGFFDFLIKENVLLKDSVEKLYITVAYAFLVYLAARVKYYFCVRSLRENRFKSVMGFIDFTFLSLLVVSFLPIPVWEKNRLWIGFCFLALVFFYCFLRSERGNEKLVFVINFLVVLLNISALLSHQGAREIMLL